MHRHALVTVGADDGAKTGLDLIEQKPNLFRIVEVDVSWLDQTTLIRVEGHHRRVKVTSEGWLVEGHLGAGTSREGIECHRRVVGASVVLVESSGRDVGSSRKSTGVMMRGSTLLLKVRLLVRLLVLVLVLLVLLVLLLVLLLVVHVAAWFS